MNIAPRKLIKGFFLYFAAALIVGVPVALLNGIWPKNMMGWIIIIVCGFPTLILGEFLGEKLFSQKISRELDPAKEDKITSVRRMAYALVVGIAVTALVILLGYLLRAYFTFA
jgi:hypothetical protein